MKKCFILVGYIFCSPVIFMLYLALLNYLNRDFMRCFGNGVYARKQVYKNKAGQTVILIPMIHIATKSFYKSIKKELKKCSIVLMEGVNDTGNILGDRRMGYQSIANYAALTAQKPFKIKNIINADGDISELSTDTIEGLKAVLDLYDDIDKVGISQAMTESTDLSKISNLKFDELLDSRNEVAKKCFLSLLGDEQYIREKVAEHSEMTTILDIWSTLPPEEQVICLPWGAKHITFFNEMVCEAGYKLEETQYYRLFSLISIFYEVMVSPFRSK